MPMPALAPALRPPLPPPPLEDPPPLVPPPLLMEVTHSLVDTPYLFCQTFLRKCIPMVSDCQSVLNTEISKMLTLAQHSMSNPPGAQ
jgi:hypothetical protein